MIRGSAVNQDGASGGLTVPNGVAIAAGHHRGALESARVAPPRSTTWRRTGPGRRSETLSRSRPPQLSWSRGCDAARRCVIRSAKTNIGHLEAAAGIAGVLKVVLSLEHQQLPKHLNFRNPHRTSRGTRIPVRVTEEPVSWERTDRPRIAGSVRSVSPAPTPTSSSRNHRWRARAQRTPGRGTRRPKVHGAPGVRTYPDRAGQTAANYRDWLSEHPDASLAEVCLTAGTAARTSNTRPRFWSIRSDSARELLDALADDRPAPGLVRGQECRRSQDRLVVPRSGQPVPPAWPVSCSRPSRCSPRRWPGSRTLIRRRDRQTLLLDVDLRSRCRADRGDLQQTRHAQPAIFAVEMSLARLWQSWGLEPDVLPPSQRRAVRGGRVARRVQPRGWRPAAGPSAGRLFGDLPAGGRMAAIFADPDRVERLTDEFPSPVGGRLQRREHGAVRGPVPIWSRPSPVDRRGCAAATGSTPATRSTPHCWTRHSTSSRPMPTASSSAPRSGSLICNRTGAALGRHRQARRRLLAPPLAPAGRVRQRRVATLAELRLHHAVGSRTAAGADTAGSRAPGPDCGGRLRPSRRCAAASPTAARSRRPSPRAVHLPAHQPDFGAVIAQLGAGWTCRPILRTPARLLVSPTATRPGRPPGPTTAVATAARTEGRSTPRGRPHR